jgi:hypothetical protein
MADDKIEELFKQLREIDMANAKQELLGALERVGGVIKCATIKRDKGYWDDDDIYTSSPAILLKEGYTPAEYEEFLEKLNFEYDNGYGGQILHGIVWLMEDNTWIERGEYDGSEWWEYRKCPQILDDLKSGW